MCIVGLLGIFYTVHCLLNPVWFGKLLLLACCFGEVSNINIALWVWFFYSSLFSNTYSGFAWDLLHHVLSSESSLV
jgi:hypothetical protein